MRIDFNQKGSWRKGPDIPKYAFVYVIKNLERVGDAANAALRLVHDDGDVIKHRDPYGEWRDVNMGGVR